jgi:hypothetical protein
MKHLLMLLLGFTALAELPSQNPLSDARQLLDLFQESTSETDKRVALRRGVVIGDDIAAILKNYLPDTTDFSVEKLQDGMEAAFSENPFIRLQVTDANLVTFALSGKSGLNSGPSSQASGFSVGGFADGLSRFLVMRTKQELSQAFFQGFKEKIQVNPYLRHFCPVTRQHLLMIDQDVYRFNEYLEGMRESFILDMTALPGNTENFLRDADLCAGCAQKPEGMVMIDLLHVGQQLVDGEAPIDMIAYLARPQSAIQGADIATQPVLYDMAGGLRFLNLVSESLRNNESADPKMPWFTGTQIREMFTDRKLFRLYLGLLWQQSGGIAFADANRQPTIAMRGLLSSAARDVSLFQQWRTTLESLGERTHSVQRSVQANTATRESVSDDFFRYSEALTGLLETVNATGRILFNRTREQDLIPTEYIFFMRQCNALYFNVRQRNYTGAISNVIFCLNQMQREGSDVATMLRYANFVASIAEANSPEEVESAIDLFALPSGSSRLKKQPGRFAIALNAYSGLAGGGEILDGDDSGKPFGAIMAPAGLSLSWGLGRRDAETVRDWGSLGFFVPLIDVGAVTAFRFQDDAAENLPDLTWRNILSPGLYLVYDTPGRWPMALGVGGQAGPGLRSVTVDGVEIGKGGIRYGGFLSVDIPISYFYLGKKDQN